MAFVRVTFILLTFILLHLYFALDGDPTYTGNQGERQYRLYGNKDAKRGVNHSTMAWYAWRASKDDLG